MFSDLDPILHSQLRLAIVSLLIAEEKADFARIKEITKATSGNISVSRLANRSRIITPIPKSH